MRDRSTADYLEGFDAGKREGRRYQHQQDVDWWLARFLEKTGGLQEILDEDPDWNAFVNLEIKEEG